MKKVLLTLTAVAGLVFATQAQEYGFNKGNFIVEGNLNLNTSKDKSKEIKTTEFNFSPKAGYFFTDKLAAGINLHVGTEKNDRYGAGLETKSNNFGAGLFGRYYFLELGSRFKTYAEVNADYLNTKSEYTEAGSTVKHPKVNAFEVGAGIGANYFLTDKIAVNFALSNLIGFKTSKEKGGESSNSFGMNINEYNNFFDAATFGLTFKF